jgi:hypothetical protein
MEGNVICLLGHLLAVVHMYFVDYSEYIENVHLKHSLYAC